MFYSETILSRRGPLGKVWLAAHMERKLSKAQTLQTDIGQSVDAIMGQEVEVMALRLSGQLLLGVVRIYSRKAKYLLDDCNEALLKIKMAFRPGIVDMTEDQLAVNKHTITLQTGEVDLDLLLPDVNWHVDFEDRTVQSRGHHQARVDDITLRAVDNLQDFDYAPFDVGPSDGIGSQDFDLELGLDWEIPLVSLRDDEMSIGVGRDASGHRDSFISRDLPMGRDFPDADMDILSHVSKTQEPSVHPLEVDVDMAFPDLDGVDLGIGFDDVPLPGVEQTPGQTRATSRASSSLSEPPKTPLPDEPIGVELPAPSKTTTKRNLKEQKQVIDAVIELQDGPGPRIGRGRWGGGLGAPVTQDVSDIIINQQFLPRSSVIMRLRAIRGDPIAHFLPTKATPQGTFICASPPGLAPELSLLFMRSVAPGLHAGQTERESPWKKSPQKRSRLGHFTPEGDEEEVEQARRAGSHAPSLGLGSEVLVGLPIRGPVGGDSGEGFLDFGDLSGGAAVEDFQLPVPEFNVSAGEDELTMLQGKSATPLSRRSRLTTTGLDDRMLSIVEDEEMFVDASCPIAIFDGWPSQMMEKEKDGSGYNKYTLKAIGLLRHALQPVAGQEEEDKVLSLRRMADKASRRAASTFFFELLVLATRDCVKLDQDVPFGNIEVRAKDRLWEQHRHPHTLASSLSLSGPASRDVSVARSFGSALAL